MKFAFVALIAGASAIKLDKDFYFARDNGRNQYERVPTTRFSGDHDDIFMRSMIMNYAQEATQKYTGEFSGGKEVIDFPSGNFWMGKAPMERAAKEVVGTHKGISGADLDAYMTEYFQKTWDHFDVNGAGAIEVEKSGPFMRFLLSDQYV